MKIDELLDLLRARRSIRRFKPDPIPNEYLEKMIEAARWAPSGANAQPWEFIIIKDPKTKQTMAELYRQVLKESYFIEQTRVEELRHHQLSSPRDDLPGFKDAPALIVVCGDRRTYQASVLSGRFIGGEGGLDGTYQKNIGNATYSLILAAAALGLGAQWVTVGGVWEQLLKPLLDVPPILLIHTVVPVGYPAYEPATPYRRSAAEIVHSERYDRSKFRSGDQIIEFLGLLRRHTKPAYDQERPPR
ncbi:nitroreductase family protein [Chloroflexota bacterium]